MEKNWYAKSHANHTEFLKRAQQKGKLLTGEAIQDFLATAISGEAGELANLHKKRMRGDEINLAKLTPDEAADIYIYLHHYAKHMEFDLDDAAALKVDIVAERLNPTHQQAAREQV